VGPRLGGILEKVGVTTVRDILYHFPRRHEDRTHFAKVSRLVHGEPATILGTVIASDNASTRAGWLSRKSRWDDGSGVVVLTWFNQKFRKEQFQKLRNRQIVAYGVPQFGRWGVEIANPEWSFSPRIETRCRADGSCRSTRFRKGFQDQVRKVVRAALGSCADLVPEVRRRT